MFWPKRKTPDLSSSRSVVLVAEDIFLRPAAEQDVRQWIDVRRQNADYLQPFEPLWPKNCLDEDFFFRRLRRVNDDWDNDRAYCFLVFDIESEQLIGGVNINNVARGAAQYAALGYWIAKDRQGRGLMRQAVRASLDFSFGSLSLARMNAACLPHNTRSKNLLLSLGFTEEGFAKSYIQINGVREDHILFGLNAQDFSGVSGYSR